MISGWKAALKAYDDAARSGNWQSQTLRKVFATPLLESVQKNLRNIQAAGDVVVGDETVLSARVVERSTKTSKLLACVQDDEIVVDKETRRPVSGVLGHAGQEKVNATLINTAIAWKVQSQTVAEERC